MAEKGYKIYSQFVLEIRYFLLCSAQHKGNVEITTNPVSPVRNCEAKRNAEPSMTNSKESDGP